MKNNKIKVGIIGCGVIGSSLARYCVESLSEDVKLETLFDVDKKKTASLKGTLKKIKVARSLDEVINLSDLVIEAASIDVAGLVLEKTANLGKDVMIMSVGGIVEREDLLSLARKNNCKVYIPSGAILGLDGIKAASLRKIDQVILTTKKPASGLKGAPYIEKMGIALDSLKTETLIFEGSAKEAIKAFPKNINVSATLSLAGIGIKKTKVRIICSPRIKTNIHEVELSGEFGKFFIKTENVPSPENPKTSYLAVLSAMATLKGIVDSVKVGT